MALFGAIIAVGLGPAMWLGAQFGTAIDVPARPPAVTSEHGTQPKTQDKGGEAGSAPDTTVIIRTTPEAVTKPLSPVTRRPGSSKKSKPPVKSSASPSPSSVQSSAPSDGGPPTPPDQPPGGGTDQGTTQPPSPPADQNPGGGGGTGDGQPVAG